MTPQVDRNLPEDISTKMLSFANHLYQIGLPEAAAAYEDFARELDEGVTRDRLGEISAEVSMSLRAGPMSISDRYVTNLDGSPDESANESYFGLIQDLRKFARSNLRGKGISRFFGGFH
ncbi:hypothetical protein [Paeniglutamicibacter kerguelensis]|uniref:Uncharacterized protein n=1 Tax=Paeniglutamicibacter kerguelensis TaxID=254788 RepID=A0ABS4XJW0_9MICC|nr:hypothetical protein [Paeniglutamicibacter kerguelensis]MBP2388746.1 hypothetical protein [Paeniglutamicibacter kerguelensis]